VLDDVALTPEELAVRLGPLTLMALAEVFGQPLASPEQAGAARRAAEERTGKTREGALANLQRGAAGVKRWNKLDRLEREAVGSLEKIDLSRCHLAGVNLRDVNCTAASFEGADLSKATLRCTILHKANLKGADLSEVEAFNVLLGGANLEGATLRAGKFSCGRFQKTNLRSADLTGAVLKHAILKGADLTGAVLTDVDFDRAEYDASTIFPASFTPPGGMKVRVPKPKGATAAARPPEDPAFASFFTNLSKVAVRERIKMALSMLKAERFQLFAEAADDRVLGVVRSQSSKDRVYACRVTAAGQYECGTQNLRPCGGLQGRVCKHLLVLILGLARAGTLDGERAFQWLEKSLRQKPTFDKEAMTATFLKYKSAEAGQVDWRPTETVPEDFYAL
jgi:uncharacterized protein YjbI with pentapeptide repeats